MPVVINVQEIKEVSSKDEELQAVIIKMFGERELVERHKTVSSSQERVDRHWRGTTIVVPTSLRKRVAELAHEGYQWIVKMKDRLPSNVWWPGIDKDVESATDAKL